MPQNSFHDLWWSAEDAKRLYARNYPSKGGFARLSVMCLHGLTRNSADFEEVAPYLSAMGHRVIVPDMRGRGRSEYDENPINYNIFTYAKDIIRLIDHLGIGRLHFIGTSMGGLITMIIHSLRPDLFSGVVFNDVGPYLSSEGLSRIAKLGGGGAKGFADWQAAAAYAKASNGLAFPHYNDNDWLAMAKRLCIEKHRGHIVLNYDPNIMKAFEQPAPDTPISFDMSAYFIPMAVCDQLMLIRGALSDIVGHDEASQMQALAPDMVRLDLDGIGHAPMLSEPDAKSAIEGFFKT